MKKSTIYYQSEGVTIFHGDCLDVLPMVSAASVHCCVTSPPYWGLRDYGEPGQLGLEPTPEEYVEKMVDVFRLVWRVLRDDGTLWLVIGDSYASGGERSTGRNDTDRETPGGRGGSFRGGARQRTGQRDNLKPKDLVGIPWRVAFALQADGWYLRQDIIWQKPNPMPESVTDRCTKAHEYIFLLTKSEKYHYDHEAIKEESIDPESHKGRLMRTTNMAVEHDKEKHATRTGFTKGGGPVGKKYPTRNKRDVWTVNVASFNAAHFATFPPKLIEPCILAGCPEGGLVLDPFHGAGTTAMVAQRNGRQYVGCEINSEYIDISKSRLQQTSLF